MSLMIKHILIFLTLALSFSCFHSNQNQDDFSSSTEPEYVQGAVLPGLKEYDEEGAASMQFYVNPGETLSKKIEILAEIPTELGNIMVEKLKYHLYASNKVR